MGMGMSGVIGSGFEIGSGRRGILLLTGGAG